MKRSTHIAHILISLDRAPSVPIPCAECVTGDGAVSVDKSFFNHHVCPVGVGIGKGKVTRKHCPRVSSCLLNLGRLMLRDYVCYAISGAFETSKRENLIGQGGHVSKQASRIDLSLKKPKSTETRSMYHVCSSVDVVNHCCRKHDEHC